MKKGMIKLKDKTDIFYEEVGRGENLFLLHGNGGDSSYFEYNLGELSKNFHLYLIDFRDHGRSGNTKDKLTFDLMANDLNEVFEKLGIKKSHLLGFSDGANLALVFSIKYPTLVNKLILNAPNTRFDGTKLFSKILSICENIFWNILPFFKRNKRVASLLLKDLKVNREDLSDIRNNVLILVGSRDLIRLGHVKNITKYIDNCKLIIVKKVGHKFARIKPGLFNKLVIKFLKEE
ncbi:alpha/beta hydrolase [uncultured Anaerococcus sp.]|uniref:alpha/beta fold hydrolase n=1 Tax=uncultured Anaerococcus sp. TaxID=293428 RepID=UPI002623C7ED|nr:alpha/beta hydrolase [uncultured Anaerococcus sp.]